MSREALKVPPFHPTQPGMLSLSRWSGIAPVSPSEECYCARLSLSFRNRIARVCPEKYFQLPSVNSKVMSTEISLFHKNKTKISEEFNILDQQELLKLIPTKCTQERRVELELLELYNQLSVVLLDSAAIKLQNLIASHLGIV